MDRGLLTVAAVCAAGIVAGVVAWRRRQPPAKKTTTTTLVPSAGERLVEAVLRDLPTPESVLGPPSLRWDAILGGKKAPGVWGYYEYGQPLTHPPELTYGTTCGVAAAAWAEEAGYSPLLINRDPPGGSGFKIGKHISRLYQGAKAIGWLVVPSSSPLVAGAAELEPLLKRGDIYCAIHKNAAGQDVEHVGVVLFVGERQADGSYVVETGDGGQTDQAGEQCAKRRKRTLRGHDLTLTGQTARIAWIVRAAA